MNHLVFLLENLLDFPHPNRRLSHQVSQRKYQVANHPPCPLANLVDFQAHLRVVNLLCNPLAIHQENRLVNQQGNRVVHPTRLQLHVHLVRLLPSLPESPLDNLRQPPRLLRDSQLESPLVSRVVSHPVALVANPVAILRLQHHLRLQSRLVVPL